MHHSLKDSFPLILIIALNRIRPAYRVTSNCLLRSCRTESGFTGHNSSVRLSIDQRKPKEQNKRVANIAPSDKRKYVWRTALPAPFSCKGAGIYAILNCLNGKIYIGSALRLNHRWTEHRCELEDGTHGNRYLRRAFLKEPDAFQVSVIELLDRPTKEVLLAREQFWMDFYQSWKPENGYNIAPKAESCQGITRDPEYVARVAAALRGRKPTAETRAKISAAQIGRPKKKRDERNKNLMRMLSWGRTKSPEQKAKWLASMLKNPRRFNRKPILQIAFDGSLVRRFECVKDAELVFGKRTNISAVCKGKRPHCLGYKWQYV